MEVEVKIKVKVKVEIEIEFKVEVKKTSALNISISPLFPLFPKRIEIKRKRQVVW